MGNRGRFGKYGDHKRIARLRQARIRAGHTRGGIPPLGKQPPGDRGKGHFREAPVRLRPANRWDANFIRDLSKHVFHHYGPYDEILPRWFLSGRTVTILALMKGQPVGFAMLGQGQAETSVHQVCELLAIAVRPMARKQGIADRLMAAILREAEKLKVDILVLHTGTENEPAHGLFKKHGFTPASLKNNFYPEGQDALMMFRDML